MLHKNNFTNVSSFFFLSIHKRYNYKRIYESVSNETLRWEKEKSKIALSRAHHFGKNKATICLFQTPHDLIEPFIATKCAIKIE